MDLLHPFFSFIALLEFFNFFCNLLSFEKTFLRISFVDVIYFFSQISLVVADGLVEKNKVSENVKVAYQPYRLVW